MKNWKSILGLALSAIFLWLAFRNIDWLAFGRATASISLPLFVEVMGVVLVSLAIRGVRWRYLLLPVRAVSPITLFWSTTIGFGMNNVLPARLGEIARAYSASKRGDVPFGAAFGTIVVERLYDTFSALFLFAGAVAFFDFTDLQAAFGVSAAKVSLTLGVGGTGLLAAVVFLKWKTETAIGVFRFFARPMPDRWTERLVELFRSFVAGLTQSGRPRDLAAVVILSVAIWIISAVQIHYTVATFGIHLSLQATIILVVAIIMAVAIPAAPGYVGVYHYLAQQALVRYAGIDPTTAASIAVVVHASNYIPQTLTGLLRFAYEGWDIRALKTLGAPK